MAKLLCRSVVVFMILLLAFNVTFAWVETLGPKDSEIIKWKESMRAKSANERIVAPKPTYKSKVVQSDPECVPLRNIQSFDYEFDVAQGFEATIDYTRPTYGQFIFEGTDSMGVWFRPATDCKILKVQILFSDESGLLGEQLTVNINDVPDVLPTAVSPQVAIDGNGDYGFTEYMKCIPSPCGALLGSVPLNVTKVGFNLATGWCEADLTTLGFPSGIDVGKRDFFIAVQFPEGNSGDADVYYGPGEEQHASGDYHSFKWYHTGGTYSPGTPNWVSRLNFTLRVVVDYYGDPPPFIEDVTELNSVYYSCDPGPYTVLAHIYDIGTSTFTGAVTKAQLIYFTEEISVADTVDITASGVSDIYTGQIPTHPVGTTVFYYFRAEDNGLSGPDATMHWARIAPKSFQILEANPDATLLVVHDGSSADVDMYKNVLDEGGWMYDVWNTTTYGEPTLCALEKYSSLFWLQGIGTSGVLGANLDTTIVPDYLDAGGNMLLVSTDYIGLVEGENFTGEWTTATWSFLTDYLKVSSFASDANQDADANSTDSLYIGEDGNVLSDFLGADTLLLLPKTKSYPYYGSYYSWADEVAPQEGTGIEVPFWVFSESDDDWVEASSMYDGTYKTIFFPFYLEAAADIEQFNTIVKNVLAFFGEKAAPIAVIESGPRYAVAANAGAMTVTASASDGDGTVESMELGTSTDGVSYTWSAMTAAEGKYTASIAELSVDDTLFYQVRATDNDGLKGYAGPWAFNKVDFTPAKDLLYCGDDPYDWYYGGKVDSIVVASLARVAAGEYDVWDVDMYGMPSYLGFLENYESVIWHGYADWTDAFPEATVDNTFYPFVVNGGNLCFSSEEKVAASHFDDGDYSPTPGEAAYDVLGIAWVGYDWCYDSIKVVTDPLVDGMDANIKLNELPFGYMAELFDAVNMGVTGNDYILDAWLAPAGYDYWYSQFGVPGMAWKENFGSKKVIVPFPLAALNDANRDAFLGNVIEWFGTGNAIKTEPGALPTAFALKQNFPNPFNPTTTIRYELPNSENVHLTIYNTLGQKVRTLVSGQHSAGRYTVLWDGKDDAGRTVGSGLYFYQVQAGNFVKTAKMVFLK